MPNTSLGDSAGTPVANAVTVVQPGQTVNVPVTATVGHPGWYRISLAQGPSSGQTLTTLPDPKAQTGTNCTPAIVSNPVWSTTQPILADGLPTGSTATTMQTGSQTFQVKIPSTASCSTAQPCSLQVVMIMTDHPANDCYYHHCADVVVSSGSAGSSGSGGAAATGGAGGRGSGGNGAGGAASGGRPGQAGSTGTASGGSPGQGGSTGTASGGSPGTGGVTETGGTGATASGGANGSGGATASGGANGSGGPAPPPPGSSGGCTCAVAEHPQASWAFGAAGLLALVIARRRRR